VPVAAEDGPFASHLVGLRYLCLNRAASLFINRCPAANNIKSVTHGDNRRRPVILPLVSGPQKGGAPPRHSVARGQPSVLAGTFVGPPSRQQGPLGSEFIQYRSAHGRMCFSRYSYPHLWATILLAAGKGARRFVTDAPASHCPDCSPYGSVHSRVMIAVTGTMGNTSSGSFVREICIEKLGTGFREPWHHRR